MADFETLRDRTLALFPELLSAAGRRGADTATRRLAAAQERLRDSRLTVVVCGEFKRRKSSLLNALLEEDPPLFPVDAVLATSLVSVVSWGETERITVGFEGVDGALTERSITRTEIADYATEAGNPGNDKRVASVISVQTPNTRLRSGVVVVDTPGVGGVMTAHSAVTTGFLPSADAIVFVSDFTQPLTASELDFLRQASQAAQVTGDIDALIFVVTKADRVIDEQREQLLTNTRAKLAEVTGQSAQALTIVPVSSKVKRAYLATGDPLRLTESNFPVLEALLWPAVERRRARVILSAALTDIDASVCTLLQPVETERAALEAETRERVAELRGQVEQRRQELEELHRGRAEWRNRLRAEIQQIGRDLRYELEAGLDAVWHRFDVEYLQDPDNLADPQRLVGKLASDVALVAGSVSELAQRRAAGVQRSFAREHGLELQLPEVAALPAPPVPPLEVTGLTHRADSTDRGWDKVRSGVLGAGVGSTAGATGGAVAGAIIGTFLFPGLGTELGAYLGGTLGSLGGTVFGTTKGVQTTSRQHQRADLAAQRHSISTELRPLRKSQARDLRAALDRLLDGLTDAVLAELDSRIEQEQEGIADAVTRLTQTERSTQQQASARQTALEAERRPLLRVRVEVGRLAAEAERLRRRPTETVAVAAMSGAEGSGPGRDLDWADE